MFGVSLGSQSGQCACQVMPAFGVGELECALGRAQQSGADQRCSDAPRGCGGGLAGPGTSRPRPRPD